MSTPSLSTFIAKLQPNQQIQAWKKQSENRHCRSDQHHVHPVRLSLAWSSLSYLLPPKPLFSRSEQTHDWTNRRTTKEIPCLPSLLPSLPVESETQRNQTTPLHSTITGNKRQSRRNGFLYYFPYLNPGTPCSSETVFLFLIFIFNWIIYFILFTLLNFFFKL